MEGGDGQLDQEDISINDGPLIEVPLFCNPLLEEEFGRLQAAIDVSQVTLANLIDYFMEAKAFVYNAIAGR